MTVTRAEMIAQLKLASGHIDEVLLELQKQENPIPQPPVDPWDLFVQLVAKCSEIPNNAKILCVAQAIRESARGESKLAREHRNFHGMKWREELAGLAEGRSIKVPSEPRPEPFCWFPTYQNAVKGWLRFLNRWPYKGWKAYANNPYALVDHIQKPPHRWAEDDNYALGVKKLIPEAATLLGNHGWVADVIIAPSRSLSGLKVLLDPGHSKRLQGASSRNRTFTEYAMNMVQAEYLREFLEKHGADVEVYDPNPDSLRGVGAKAHGKDLYISLHHNAANADGNDEGTEVYTAHASSVQCRVFASHVSRAISLAIGSQNRGAKVKDFTVIATATRVGCPFAILTESYFIDDYSNVDTATERSLKAAEAIGEAIMERFGE
jgi:N-acetylmuramoyl-L-alanine amidase